MDAVKAKATEVVQEDFAKFQAVAAEAASSGAFLYPIKVS